MDYKTDLSLEEIDSRLRLLGYEKEIEVIGVHYRKGTFPVEITFADGKYVINYPISVNSVPHPLTSRMLEFASLE